MFMFCNGHALLNCVPLAIVLLHLEEEGWEERLILTPQFLDTFYYYTLPFLGVYYAFIRKTKERMLVFVLQLHQLKTQLE